MNDTSDQYWLGRWVDEYEVRRREDVARLFTFPGPVSRLAELASAAPTFHKPRKVPDLSVAAGRGIDLSGYMSCGAFECMRKQVDRSYGRILHYFDYIIAEGLSPRGFLERLESTPKRFHVELQYELEEDVAILLYLRKIGAAKHVIFQDKPRAYCKGCMDSHAHRLHIPSYTDSSVLDHAAERIEREAEIRTHWRKGFWNYWVLHDFFDEPASGQVKRAKKKPLSREEVARAVIKNYSGGSLADVVFASAMNSPLARVIDVPWIDDATKTDSSFEEAVALGLRLPILEGVSIKDLIKLREDEQPAFIGFRDALLRAIRRQIDLAGARSPSEIANAVIREEVEPELAKIDQRLRVNQKKLSRNAGVAVGAAAITTGLIASFPLVIDAGIVAAVTATVPHVINYFTSRGDDIEMSSMYFLWSAKKLSKPNHE